MSLLYRVVQDQEDAVTTDRPQSSTGMGKSLADMVFNPDKCEPAQGAKCNLQTSYITPGQSLKETSKAKYFGVTIDSKLSGNSLIDAVTKRTNQATACLSST